MKTEFQFFPFLAVLVCLFSCQSYQNVSQKEYDDMYFNSKDLANFRQPVASTSPSNYYASGYQQNADASTPNVNAEQAATYYNPNYKATQPAQANSNNSNSTSFQSPSGSSTFITNNYYDQWNANNFTNRWGLTPMWTTGFPGWGFGRPGISIGFGYTSGLGWFGPSFGLNYGWGWGNGWNRPWGFCDPFWGSGWNAGFGGFGYNSWGYNGFGFYDPWGFNSLNMYNAGFVNGYYSGSIWNNNNGGGNSPEPRVNPVVSRPRGSNMGTINGNADNTGFVGPRGRDGNAGGRESVINNGNPTQFQRPRNGLAEGNAGGGTNRGGGNNMVAPSQYQSTRTPSDYRPDQNSSGRENQTQDYFVRPRNNNGSVENYNINPTNNNESQPNFNTGRSAGNRNQDFQSTTPDYFQSNPAPRNESGFQQPRNSSFEQPRNNSFQQNFSLPSSPGFNSGNGGGGGRGFGGGSGGGNSGGGSFQRPRGR